MIAFVLMIVVATDTAFNKAFLVTFAGSMIPKLDHVTILLTLHVIALVRER
jgi:hypothetical protein